MEFIEVSAKTVDDAITKACIELQAASDKLEIQVISEGSSGFFGIGSKPAVIRAAVKAAPEKEPEAPQRTVLGIILHLDLNRELHGFEYTA